MKKVNLTLEEMKQIFQSIPPTEDNLVGFIGNIPIYSNPFVPRGIVYLLNNKSFKILKRKKK